MWRDFNKVVKNFDGSSMTQPIYKTDANGVHVLNERGEPQFEKLDQVPIKKFLFDVLGAQLQGENLTGSEKWARYSAASKIAAAGYGATEIDGEDVKTLLAAAEKGLATIVYGQVRVLLETDPEPIAKMLLPLNGAAVAFSDTAPAVIDAPPPGPGLVDLPSMGR